MRHAVQFIPIATTSLALAFSVVDVLAMDALISARGSILTRLNWKSARHVGKRIGRPLAPRKRAP